MRHAGISVGDTGRVIVGTNRTAGVQQLMRDWSKTTLTEHIHFLETVLREAEGADDESHRSHLVDADDILKLGAWLLRVELVTCYHLQTLYALIEQIAPNLGSSTQLNERVRQVEQTLREREKGLKWIDNLIRHAPETEKAD